MLKTKIYGAGKSLGTNLMSTRQIVEDAGLVEKFGVPASVIEDSTGISHVVQCNEPVTPGELAIEAALEALSNSPIEAKDIGMVLYCGIEGDFSEPATAQKVAQALGIPDDTLQYCWDVSNACHGFTSGLITAEALICAGRVEFALICTGERSSTKTRWIQDQFVTGKYKESDIKDRLGAFTVGDAGGAMIVGVSEDSAQIKHISNRNLTKRIDLCYWRTGSQTSTGIPDFGMKMAQICASTKSQVKKMVPGFLADVGWSPLDIDHAIFHQVGVRVCKDWTHLLGVAPEKVPISYPQRGNLASATLPVIWSDLQDNDLLIPGQNVAMISTGSPVIVSMLGICT